MPPLVLKNFDDLKDFVGREIGVTDWFEIAQDRILKFAEATEDRQWIHLDPARAQRESPYGTTISRYSAICRSRRCRFRVASA